MVASFVRKTRRCLAPSRGRGCKEPLLVGS